MIFATLNGKYKVNISGCCNVSKLLLMLMGQMVQYSLSTPTKLL